MKNNFGCPVQGTINVLSGKWKVLLVWHLGFRPRRFAELRDLLSKAGDELIPMMTELCHWGTRHLGIPPNLPMIRRAKSRSRKSIAA